MVEQGGRQSRNNPQVHYRDLSVFAIAVVVTISFVQILASFGSDTRYPLSASPSPLPANLVGTSPSSQLEEKGQHDDSSFFSQMSSTVISNKKQVRFLFFMGVEGTGHHYLAEIMKNSPARAVFEEWQMMRSLRQLSGSLWNHKTLSGLFNAWCHRLKYPDKYLSVASTTRAVAQQMQRIEATILQRLQQQQQMRQDPVRNTTTTLLRQRPDPESIIYVPVNVMIEDHPHTGMMSYPNYYAHCRGSPDIHLWYEACTMAQVDCQHVFLRRPLTDFLQSAIRRGCVKTLVSALTNDYLTAFSQILVQLTQFPDQTKACIGVLGTPTTEPSYKFGMDSETRRVLQETLGWNWPWQPQPQNNQTFHHSNNSTSTTSSTFEGYLESVYLTPTSNNASHLMEERDGPWWNSLQQLERQIDQVCRSNVERNQNKQQQ